MTETPRSALETWVKWWDNVGRYHYTHPSILPPLKATREALSCSICQGIDLPEGEHCRACGRNEPYDC